MEKIKEILNWILENLQELWAWLNRGLKKNWRKIILTKIVDNLIAYSLYTLLITSILYGAVQLGHKIFENFWEYPDPLKPGFPFVLDFSEYLFLYSLPIFIVFGFINFYELQWKRQINQSNEPNPDAKESLTLSKKLFFSSLLSYLSLKMIDILFFKYEEENFDMIRLIATGVFFLVITIIVLIQSKHHKKPDA